MLRQKLKLTIVPIVAICMIVGLSSFVGLGEIKGGVCLNDNTNMCTFTLDDGTKIYGTGRVIIYYY